MSTPDSGFLDYEGLYRVVDKINTKFDTLIANTESLPIGSIIMWSGGTVPDKWVICDGQNGTPDLRGRFVMASDSSHPSGSTGGSATHTLTVTEMPAHKHTTSGVSVTTGTTGGSLFSGGDNIITPVTSTETGSAGGGSAFSILPPYYALAYIMKVSA